MTFPHHTRRSIPTPTFGNFTQPSGDEYLSPAQVAQRIPFSVASLEAMRWRGIGAKYERVGRRVIYKWSDVVEWLQSGGGQ